MKNITLIFLLFSTLAFSQSLKPVIGVKFSGGVSYDMDHEYFSGVAGLRYEPLNENFAFADVTLSGEYIYDYLQEFNGQHNFYVLKVQAAKPVSDFLSFTYFGGYMNLLSSDTKRNFKPLKTNLTLGAGIRLTSNELTAEALYENLGGYPHISVGVVFPLWELLR